MRWSRPTTAFSLLAVIAALAVAGCGSSSKESKPSTSANPSTTSTAAATSSSSAASSSVVAKAQEEFKKYEKPIGLENLPKIDKPIPTGKSIDFVICAPAACVPPARYTTELASILGWKTKTIDAGESPGAQQAAMQQTVTEKPSAVVIEGLATEILERQIDALKAEKVPVLLWQVAGAKEEIPRYYTIPGPTLYKEETKALAAASVVAGGEEAEIGLMAVPAFPIYAKTISPEFKEAVTSLCPKCKVDEYQLPVSSLGKNATSLITNYVRGHPGIKVVVNEQDVTSLGLEAALKGAGITDVKDIGLYATEANLPDLAAETEYAIVPDPYHEMAGLIVDSLARVYTGGSPKPDIETSPGVQLWTKTTVPAFSKGVEPPVISSYKTTFEKIWGK